MIKVLDPKTEKAKEFCNRYGTRFQVVGRNGNTIAVVALETLDILECEMADGKPVINGEVIEW